MISPESGITRNRRVAKNTFFLYLRMFFVLLVSLYTTRVILRVLGVEDYGVYNVVAGFVTMFSFLNTSLAGAIQRFYNYETSQKGEEGTSSVYSLSLVIQFGLSLIVLLLLETIGVWYLNTVMVVPSDRLFAANILFQSSTLSLVILILSIPFSAAILSFEKMDYYAAVGIIDVLLKLLIIIVLPYVPYDKLISYSILLLLISITNFLLYYIYSKRNFASLRFSHHYVKNKAAMKQMLSFAGWNVFGTFSNVIYTQGTNILLNYFFGPIVNAAKGIAGQIMSAIQSFSLNVLTAFRPQLVNSYAQSDFERTKKLMFIESKVCFVLMCALSVPLIVEMDYILNIWLGDNVPEYASLFSCLVLVHVTITSLNQPFSQVIHAIGKMKVFQLVTGGITCMIIPASYLAFKFGATPSAVFWIGIIMAILTQISCAYIVNNIFYFGLKHYLIDVILRCLVFVIILPIMPVAVHLMMRVSFGRLIIVTCVSLMVSALLAYYVVLNKKDRASICNLIKLKSK